MLSYSAKEYLKPNYEQIYVKNKSSNQKNKLKIFTVILLQKLIKLISVIKNCPKSFSIPITMSKACLLVSNKKFKNPKFPFPKNPWQLKTSFLFQPCVLLLSCRLYYFSLHDDYPPFLYTTWSIYIAALPFLKNWNERRCSKSNILTMNHKIVFENCSEAAANTLQNTIIYLKAVKYLNIRLRQIY